MNRSRDGKQINILERETHGLVDQARVKVHVGVQVAATHELALACVLGQFRRGIQQLVASGNLKDLLGKITDGRGARIRLLVDAVSKPDEDSLLALHLLDESRHVLRGSNLHQLTHRRLARTSVAGTVESCTTGSDGGVRVHEGRTDLHDTSRGAVDLVVAVDQEQCI